MTYRNFEIRYCPHHAQNICVEALCHDDGSISRRCLYSEENSCQSCDYQELKVPSLEQK